MLEDIETEKPKPISVSQVKDFDRSSYVDADMHDSRSCRHSPGNWGEQFKFVVAC